jgi:hypothetical protein
MRIKSLASLILLLGAAHVARAADDEAPVADRFAAFAYGIEVFDQVQYTGNTYEGRAVSEATEATAADTAVYACAFQSCEVKVYVEKGCIGIAKGYDPNNIEWTGFGAVKLDTSLGGTLTSQKQVTRTLAGQTAVEGCGGGTLNQQCQVVETYCTWDVSGTAPAAADVTAWVTEMGGQQSDGIQGLLYYFHIAADPLLINSLLTYQQSMCISGGQWARVEQVAAACNLSIDQLDRLYVRANPPTSN